MSGRVLFGCLAALTGLTIAATAGWSQPAKDNTFARLLASPDDPAINLRFAAEAEARGELRHAVAALERARAARPDDPVIAAEYERVRRKTLPAITVGTLQAGLSFASNPLQVNSSDRRKSDGVVDISGAIDDERTILDTRVRTQAFASGQWHKNATEIDTARIGVSTGPIFSLSKDVSLHVAPGATHLWLEGQRLYDEVNTTVTLSTVFGGLSQAVSAKGGWRHGNDDLSFSDSRLLDIEGRFVLNPQLINGDYVYLQPRYVVSRSLDTQNETVTLPTVLGSATAVSRDLSPLSYQEWGGRLAYFFPVAEGRVFLGAGVSVFDRHYDSFVLDPAALAAGVPVATNEKRRDLYVEPTAHVVFPRLLGPKLDLRLDYRLEDNFSNDESREFRNHVAGFRVVGSF